MGATFGRLIVLGLAAVTGVIAIFSIWANGQLLDTSGWTSVSGNLLESKEVRHRVAVFLGEELTGTTEAQLDAAGQGAIAEEVIPRLRANQVHLAEEVMATKRFRKVWTAANRSGQRELVRVLDEEGPADGGVYVDLTPALRQIAEELDEDGLVSQFGNIDLAAQVQPGSARIKVLEAAELSQAQDVVRVVRHLTLPAVFATIALYLLALALGRERLSLAFLGIGLTLAATGALALLARALAGHEVIDQLLGGGAGADRDAAEAAWGVVTSKISDLAGVAIGIGAVIVLLVGAVAAVNGYRRSTRMA